ncbi:LptF/LptG family permease [Stappia sp. GBMRC 2046]|uniref:LptF/LptG family permease n=1 Tax=Stappia sediminis TaxID=2692190 RepID=A0A7X3LT68_9HYPH|nr:LptF/LptG family permease [Stappia sediminis]MXN64642.1 LptF/LptG family permease [Stappia sediminis]
MRFLNTVTLSVALGALRQVVIVLLLIEAVFVAESLTGLLETVLRNGGTLLQVTLVLALTTPEIFDFALPLAMVIGIFVTLNTTREDREIVALSAAGFSWNWIPKLAVGMGIAGCLVSLLVSGWINPVMAFQKRIMIFDLKAQFIFNRITEPGREDAIQTIKGKTFIALNEETENGIDRHLFIHQPSQPDIWRITQAQGWSLNGPDDGGRYSLDLGKVVAHDFNKGQAAEGGSILDNGRGPNLRALAGELFPSIPALPSVRVGELSLPVTLDNILQRAPRELISREWTYPDVLGLGRALSAPRDKVLKRAGQMTSRALLCFFAPLVAIAALVFSRSGLLRYLALPLGCATLLVIDTVSRASLESIAQNGLLPLGLASAVMVVGVSGGLLALAAANSSRLVIPAGQRA